MLQRKIKKLLSLLLSGEITLSTLEKYIRDEDGLYILRLVFLLFSLFEKKEKKVEPKKKFEPVSTLSPLNNKYFVPCSLVTRRFFSTSSYFF